MKTLCANPLGDMLKSSPNVSKEDTVNTLNLAQIAIGSTVDQSNTGMFIIAIDSVYKRNARLIQTC